MYFTRLKTVLILAACVLGALLCVPNLAPRPAGWLPWRTVHLGLDLQGGSYLLLEVDMDAVVKERLDSLLDAERQALRPGGVFYSTLVAQPDQDRVLLKLRDPARLPDALAALGPLAAADAASPGRPDVVLASTPDGQVTLTLAPQALAARGSQAVAQSIEIVRRRIDETGVLDPQITRQGDRRIVVQLPGIEDPGRIKELLGRTAHMTFRLVDETANPQSPPPGEDALAQQDSPAKIVVRRKIEVDGGDLTDAQPSLDNQTGQWAVSFKFNSVGARRFADVTQAQVGHRFAIVLDDKVISAPTIIEPITAGQGRITGHFTADSANDLSVLLRAGALPAPLTVIEERSVGPELGADSIRAAALSLLVGFLLVVAYMGVFYGLFGWFANLALVVNLVLMLAVLSLIGATLTLPGMAGILLTLGMAVDANILINERVREESRNGRPPLQALEAGFRRAYSTIFDSNATAFLAHVMLFVFGSGPVRGFAVTITVGIATTLFTAWMLTRLFVSGWYVRARPQALPV
jgi:protein-export membrane protein SecD